MISPKSPQTNVNYKVDKVFSLKKEECINIKWYGHKVEDSFYTDIYYMNEIYHMI